MKSYALIFSSLLLTAFAGKAASNNESGYVMKVSMPTNYAVLEPIVIEISLANATNEELFFAMGHPSLIYNIDIRDSDGNIIPLTRYGEQEEMKKSRRHIYRIRLGPEETYKEHVILSRFYDLSMAGKYTVKIKRRIHAVDTIPPEFKESPLLQFEVNQKSIHYSREWGANP
jgi:hypothetical protein